jgi:hypothetical protein
MARPEHQSYWFKAGSGCGLAGLAVAALVGTLASSSGHLDATGLLAIVAYILLTLAVVCFFSGIRKWRFPLAAGNGHAGSLTASSTALEPPAVTPPTVNVILVPEQDHDRLRLAVVNQGDSGRFSAEVVCIRDDRGNAMLGPSSWQIPWLDTNSVAPKEILHSGRGILDFVRYNFAGVDADLTSTKWVSDYHWSLASLPEPIGFTYRIVRTRAELEAQRFRVTIRIIRAEPPGSADRQLAIGVKGFDLICESLD